MLESGSGISRAIAWRSYAPHIGALSILGVFGALGGALGGAWMASGWLVNPPPVLALQAPPPVLALQAPPPVLALQAPPPRSTGALIQMVRYGAASELGVGVTSAHARRMPPAAGN